MIVKFAVSLPGRQQIECRYTVIYMGSKPKYAGQLGIFLRYQLGAFSPPCLAVDYELEVVNHVDAAMSIEAGTGIWPGTCKVM